MATRLEVESLDCGTLRDAALSVDGGRCVCVSGASGSGKSRLLRAIADLDPNVGEVRLDGRSRAAYSAPEWRRRVMLVPSESAWWAETVGEHLSADGLDDDLAMLGFMPEVRGWSVARLSSGERQRLALIRALSRHPCVLLLDEPTANMDDDTTRAVESWLTRRHQDGLALLWVSHDPEQIRRVGDRHLHIRGGRLEVAG